MDLVNAQQARRVLDRIVGYQISPLLWKKIRRGLSAGRVQSVATRLVCEREADIKAFVPQEYWSLDADLSRIAPNLGQFKASFYGREKKVELNSEAEVNAVMEAVKNAPFAVTGVKRQDKQRNPAPPFITSTLQQEASRKLNMTPRRTMSIAQQLYEGVDIEGRAPWVSSPICVPTPSACPTRPPPPRRNSSSPATARTTTPARPGSTRPNPAPRTPTRPSGPPT